MRGPWIWLGILAVLGLGASCAAAQEMPPMGSPPPVVPASVAAPATPATPPMVPLVVLDDQFGRSHYLAAERGDVVVLVYGDRSSAAANQEFGKALHVHFHPTAQGLAPAQARQAPPRTIPGWPENQRVPDVRVVAIACVGKVPPLVDGWIRSQFRSRSPDVPVCLDFEDKMKQYFGQAGGVTNVAIVDMHGRVRYRGHGTVDRAQFDQLAEFVERLRREPAATPAAREQPSR